MRRPIKLGLAAFIAVATVAGIARVKAQETPIPYQGQNTGRYQMFFGPMARADHFLVDTASGHVWMHVVDDKEQQLFQTVSVLPAPVVSNQQVGRFRVFYGAHARADLYLVDTLTGQTWQWVVDPEKNVHWFSGLTVEGISNAGSTSN